MYHIQHSGDSDLRILKIGRLALERHLSATGQDF
jgi:hypothetical protein